MVTSVAPMPGTVTIEEALEIGRVKLAQLPVDLTELSARARTYYARIEDFQSDAVTHYYGKLGYGADGANELFDLVKRFLALSAAWRALSYPIHLSLPERVDNDGWHGFIIQTRDYERMGALLDGFIHHTTTPGSQDEAVTTTMICLTEVFGVVAPTLWSDCPGCVIYGWCSDSSMNG